MLRLALLDRCISSRGTTPALRATPPNLGGELDNSPVSRGICALAYEPQSGERMIRRSAAANQSMHPFELTKALMSIPSVTGTEGKIAEFLSSHLESRGYRIERQDVSSGRFNLFAFAGDGRVMFCTHIDTVPPATIPIRGDDEFLYGRGACDTKGIIAAMLAAGDHLLQEGVTNFGYMFLVGEETDSIGAKAANTLKWNSEYVIVGEPTQNQLARAQKGTLMVNFSAIGRAAHSGYPERGISAIQNLWSVLQDCQNADWGNDA